MHTDITTTHTFGPGSLEGLTLTVRVDSRDYVNDQERVHAHLTGTYKVYCGHGNEHVVPFDLTTRAWTTDSDRYCKLVCASIDPENDASTLVDELVASHLDFTWDDPCGRPAWIHNEQRDGVECCWCGRYVHINDEYSCETCWNED